MARFLIGLIVGLFLGASTTAYSARGFGPNTQPDLTMTSNDRVGDIPPDDRPANAAVTSRQCGHLDATLSESAF